MVFWSTIVGGMLAISGSITITYFQNYQLEKKEQAREFDRVCDFLLESLEIYERDINNFILDVTTRVFENKVFDDLRKCKFLLLKIEGKDQRTFTKKISVIERDASKINQILIVRYYKKPTEVYKGSFGEIEDSEFVNTEGKIDIYALLDDYRSKITEFITMMRDFQNKKRNITYRTIFRYSYDKLLRFFELDKERDS
jgi:hypothetical protein